MDVHRCRFVPYNPQAINALAFSHPPSTEIPGRGIPTVRLAIGRANGDIEIWNPLRGAWFQETILRGGKDRSIEGLVWTLDPSDKDGEGNEIPGKLRLFSIGYSSAVTEWDLEQGRPAQHSTGNYGEIWCLAAQPRWKPSQKRGLDGKPLGPADGEFTGQHLAVGCADGSIVILSTEDGGLRYLRQMRPSTKRARVLSLTFQDRHTLIAGYADSSLRIFDIRNGRLLRTMSMGKGPSGGPKEILVWSVRCLPDGTIVSGDSAGELRFWDPKNYSLIQRINSHLADILDVAVSADGETVISGGADSRTTMYRLQPGQKGDKKRRWAEVMHRRYHTHDVKSFAVYETKDISIIVSGGLDTTPVVCPLREFGKEHHRKLSSLPQTPQLASAPASRLLMSWWDREVNVWRLSGAPGMAEDAPDASRHRLGAKVLFQGDENLTSAALSSDGKLLAASTVSEVKLFSMRRRKSDDGISLRVQKIVVPAEVSNQGARMVAISPDNRWLCVVRPNSDVYIAKIIPASSPKERPQVLPKLTKLGRPTRHARREKASHGTLGNYDRTIRCIAFSDNSRILTSGDLSGCIDAWALEGEEDLTADVQVSNVNGNAVDESDDDSDDEEQRPVHGQRWVRTPADSPIPRMGASIIFLAFRPQLQQNVLTNGASKSSAVPAEDRLMVLTGEHQLAEFEVLKGKLSDWSRRNPKTYLPAEFSGVKDRGMGGVWDLGPERERFWIYGPSWMWMFDLSLDFPQPGSAEAHADGAVVPSDEATTALSKRKRADDEDRFSGIPNSGAGDRIPLSKSDVGYGRKMRKITGKDASAAEDVVLDEPRPRGADEDEEERDEADVTAIAQLRRARLEAGTDSNDEDVDTNGQFAVVVDKMDTNGYKSLPASQQPDEEQEQEQALAVATVPRVKRRWWNTYKYREILGIAPMSGNLTDDGQPTGLGLEVAVVERPLWDVDLPERYVKDYE